MGVLLAVDVGNTNTVLGVFVDDVYVTSYRVQTNPYRSADEMALALSGFMAMDDMNPKDIDACIISTVVPSVLHGFVRYAQKYLQRKPLVVGPGIKTGMPILCDQPKEVGADRIVNSVAAFDKVKAGVIVVDFGTATTWDVISPKGEYLGGVIAPGIGISANALYERAAKLTRVELIRPPSVIGKNTVTSMQSGLVFGYAGMVDSIVRRIREEVSFKASCMATGGLAVLLDKESETIESVDEELTLKGLHLIYKRNQPSL